MAGESLPSMIRELATIRTRMKRDEVRRKALEQRLPELMVEQGQQSIKLDCGLSCHLKPNTVKVAKAWPAAETDEFHAALRSIGAGHIIKEEPSVNNASLRAVVLERMRNGEVIPDEIGYTTSLSFSLTPRDWSES